MTPEPNLRPVPDHAEPKAPRRRFTPEERIANREREIALIQEGQRLRVRRMIGEAGAALAECVSAANCAGMEEEAKRCADTMAVLAGTKKVEAG